MQRKELLAGGSILAVLILITGYLYISQNQSFHGTVISPPLPPAQIDLIDHNGNPFALAQENGKVVVIYFGYTNCQNECPLAMAHLKQVYELLGKKAADVQVLFISTDPVRDDPATLKSFLDHFESSFLGLTGTQVQLAKVWADYGVTVENGGETHSDRMYVLDRSGNFTLTFLADMPIEDMASDLRLLLK